MNKNFQDILNEQIGKQESLARKANPITVKAQAVSSLSYELLFQLGNKLEVSWVQKNPYKQQQASRFSNVIPLKPIEKAVKREVPGFFPTNCEQTLEAKLFFAHFGYKTSEGMSKEALKRSYRRLAIKLHPDTSDLKAKYFMNLKKHYEVLDSNWQPYLEAA